MDAHLHLVKPRILLLLLLLPSKQLCNAFLTMGGVKKELALLCGCICTGREAGGQERIHLGENGAVFCGNRPHLLFSNPLSAAYAAEYTRTGCLHEF